MAAERIDTLRDLVREPVITLRLRKVLLLPYSPRLRPVPNCVVRSAVPRRTVWALATGGAPVHSVSSRETEC